MTDFTESSFCVWMASIITTPVGETSLSNGQKWRTICELRNTGLAVYAATLFVIAIIMTTKIRNADVDFIIRGFVAIGRNDRVVTISSSESSLHSPFCSLFPSFRCSFKTKTSEIRINPGNLGEDSTLAPHVCPKYYYPRRVGWCFSFFMHENTGDQQQTSWLSGQFSWEDVDDFKIFSKLTILPSKLASRLPNLASNL